LLSGGFDDRPITERSRALKEPPSSTYGTLPLEAFTPGRPKFDYPGLAQRGREAKQLRGTQPDE
jgi:hypothetical protein